MTIPPLTEREWQEIYSRLCTVADSPELLDDYGVTREEVRFDLCRSFRSDATWCVPDKFAGLVVEEASEAVSVVYRLAETAGGMVSRAELSLAKSLARKFCVD